MVSASIHPSFMNYTLIALLLLRYNVLPVRIEWITQLTVRLIYRLGIG